MTQIQESYEEKLMSISCFTNEKDVSEVVLSANPDCYDYVHAIILNRDGQMSLLDGGGQCSYGYIKGEFLIQVLSENKFILKLFNLVLVDPYDESFEFSAIESFEVMVNKRNIEFRYIPCYEEHECLYTTCYDFEVDPFILLRDNCSKFADKYIPVQDEEVDEKPNLNIPHYGETCTPIPKSDVEILYNTEASRAMSKSSEKLLYNTENFSENGIYFNKLETVFYLESDYVIIDM